MFELGFSYWYCRLLDQNDADLQMKVLECLLNWKDDFLLPYSENLKNLINAKDLRDELARWSLSRTSMGSVDERHRASLVPVVVRILIPKVRNLKMLGTQKVTYRTSLPPPPEKIVKKKNQNLNVSDGCSKS